MSVVSTCWLAGIELERFGPLVLVDALVQAEDIYARVDTTAVEVPPMVAATASGVHV